MNVYTDPRLLDVGAAMEMLPTLPLDGRREQRLQATGTEGERGSLAPTVAPKPGKPCKSGSIVDKMLTRRESGDGSERVAVSVATVKSKTPSSTVDNDVPEERATGLGPATFSLGSCGPVDATGTDKRLAETHSVACTTACTNEAEKAPAGLGHADQPPGLEAIAATISKLSKSERARLAELLVSDVQTPDDDGT